MVFVTLLLLVAIPLIFVILGGVVFQYSEIFIRFLAIILILTILYGLWYLNGLLNAAA